MKLQNLLNFSKISTISSKKKYVLTTIITLLLSVLFLFVGYNYCKTPPLEEKTEMYTAKVIYISDVIWDESTLNDVETPVENKTVYFGARITSGRQKGELVNMSQYFDYLYVSQPREVKINDQIIVTPLKETETDAITWSYVEHNRSLILAVLVLAFFGIILIIGKWKGVATIFSLALTAAGIFLVYIPSILAGKNIYISTIIVTFFIILMSLILLNGINKKSICAIIGNMGGILVAGLLALIMDKLLYITGIIDQDYIYLMLLNSDIDVDLQAIVWGGILIGSLGAVMDVAMSISSAMNELSLAMEEKTIGKMVKAGMNIGKDAIGTMTNTLVLAYIGGSLATVLLLFAYNKNLLYIFSSEMIAVEVLKSIIGSMGILFAVPITVVVSAYLFNTKKQPTIPTIVN